MTKNELIKKYTDLSSRSDAQLIAALSELRTARKLKYAAESGWEELSDYEDAKADHLVKKHICQIYGQFCYDLGDA